jgi:AcrR family transcriptional regulator
MLSDCEQPMSRRDRMRDLTIAEIKATARQQMAQSGTAGISLSAIARAMEISPPALYRYFASRDDLVTALIVDAFNDLADAIQAAESAVEAETSALKIAASCLAYREWAIAHPVDFQLIYGNPIPGYVAPVEITVPLARRPFDGLVRHFLEAYRTGQLIVPTEYTPVPDTISAHLAIWLPEAGYDLPDTLVCLLMSTWARIHGMVMLELFEHLGPVVSDCAAFYRYELGAFLQQLGLASQDEGNTHC